MIKSMQWALQVKAVVRQGKSVFEAVCSGALRVGEEPVEILADASGDHLQELPEL